MLPSCTGKYGSMCVNWFAPTLTEMKSTTLAKVLKCELPSILAVFQLDTRNNGRGQQRRAARSQDAAAFEAAVKQVRAVSAKIEMTFPELNKEMAEESLAEFKRGEYQTIEDLIREIQGHSAPAH